VITVVSLLFPESSEMGPKVTFLQCQKLLTTFFVLMNEEKRWINFQKQVYKNISENVYLSEILRTF